jgi:hypothetical protein
MPQKSQRQAVCFRGSRYRLCAELEQCPFDSLAAAAAQLVFAVLFHAMPAKYLPRKQGLSGTRALATPARGWVRGQSHNNAPTKSGFLV